jgi:hypothetical protein
VALAAVDVDVAIRVFNFAVDEVPPVEGVISVKDFFRKVTAATI